MEMSSQIQAPSSLTLTTLCLSTHWVGGWMVPRVGLDAVLANESRFLGRPAHSLVTTLTNLGKKNIRKKYEERT
jgi:hypothetical protein